MKKYILSAAVFLMIAGVAGAQTTKKASTDKPAPTTTKTKSTTTSAKKIDVSKPAATTLATTNKTASTTPIKRKNHSKTKSVPASK